MPETFNIPQDVDSCNVKCGQKTVMLTNLKKVVWPELQKTKRDLLLYYAAVSRVLIPHLRDRRLVIERYTDSAAEKPILLKQLPAYHPKWLATTMSPFLRENDGDIVMAQNLASLLWIVNWGGLTFCRSPVRCDDTDRPDYMIFDLDPSAAGEFLHVREAALLVRQFLQKKKVDAYAMITGLRGIHIYIPIHRRSHCKDVWQTAKQVASNIAKSCPALLTVERIKKQQAGRVTIGCSRNVQGHTFTSAYSLRQSLQATVCTPVSWEEVERGVDKLEFTIDTIPSRLDQIGDLFKPLLQPGSRFPLEALL